MNNPYKWETILCPDDKNPFEIYCPPVAGFFNYRHINIRETIEKMYAIIGSGPFKCKPKDEFFYETQTDIMKVFPEYMESGMSGYIKDTSMMMEDEPVEQNVFDLSTMLHGLLPHPKTGLGYFAPALSGLETSKHEYREEYNITENARKEAVAIVARSLPIFHPDTVRCVPIVFNLRHCHPLELITSSRGSICPSP